MLTIASRCRGLLNAARGDLDASYRALERALELHDRLGEPFERARTLLVLGGVQRRDRKKRAARESLGRALGVFDDLGATLWAARTRAELARVGGRAPAAGLTPTEERIAALVASGQTYREAAAALFISPKTVQWNLSKIYRKLGVRSRAELAARLLAERDAHGRGDDPVDETESAMRTRLTLLLRRLRPRRDARRDGPWPLNEPVVPTLRGWPVERPGR